MNKSQEEQFLESKFISPPVYNGVRLVTDTHDKDISIPELLLEYKNHILLDKIMDVVNDGVKKQLDDLRHECSKLKYEKDHQQNITIGYESLISDLIQLLKKANYHVSQEHALELIVSRLKELR